MSYDIINHDIEQKIILLRPFFANLDKHICRDMHSHSCIELSYVLSGTSTHHMILPDGTERRDKLSAGNYIILDQNAKHAYKNGSDDFTIINLLFKLPVLQQDAKEWHGINANRAFSVTRSHWNPNGNDVELRFQVNSPVTSRDRRYLRLWLNLKGEERKIDFSSATVGVLTNGESDVPWLCAPNSEIYYLGEDQSAWQVLRCGENGGIGTLHGSSVEGFCGWFAFPLDEMVQKGNKKQLAPTDEINGVFFRFAFSDPSMAGNSICIDDICLAKNYTDLELDRSHRGMLIDFNAGSLSLGVTGKDGDTSPEAGIDQIRVSVSDNQELYDVIRAMFPEYCYSKIKTSPVNHVYFDQDGSIRSLFQLCYESSRTNMHEWRKMVYHGLSLIMIISLQSFDKYIRAQKKNIVDTVKKYVNQNYAQNITLSEICAKHFYSVPYVSHKFKLICGCSFEQYLRQVRIRRACELLLKTGLSVDEISESCGYTSVRSFRKAFKDITEVTPIEFKNKYHP